MLHLQLSERDVERLLAGDQPQGRPDLAEVARFVARLRALGDMEYPPPMHPRLLAELDAAEAAGAKPPRLEDEVRRRAEARREAHHARRRWRLVGAAAMVAMLGGIVAAQARNDTSPRSPTDTTESPRTKDTPPTTKGPDSTPTTTGSTAPPQTTAPPPPPTHATDQPNGSSSDPQVGAPGPPAVTSDNPPSDTPAWEKCGSDPECWWNLWNQYATGSRP